MEYTKDLILNVRYDEANNTVKFKVKNRTSHFLESIKRHKILMTSILFMIILIAADSILVMNFIHILETL